MKITAKRDMFSPAISYDVRVSPGARDKELLFSVVADTRNKFIKSGTIIEKATLGDYEYILDSYYKLKKMNPVNQVAIYKRLNQILKN